MSWTTPAELRAQVDRLWFQGILLATAAALAAPANANPPRIQFPLRLRLRRPTPRELGEKFDVVRQWIDELQAGSKSSLTVGYEIEWDEVNTRQLGRNRVPARISLASRDDALAFIEKTEAARTFDALAATTLARFPSLQIWLSQKPLVILDRASDWTQILDCLTWFADNPRSGLYARQVDAPGVHSKFIENNRSLLTELLDITLPTQAIDTTAVGAQHFEARFGLKLKSPQVRFRILDNRLAIAGLTDLELPIEQFAQLSLNCNRVYIVENHITGLAFPPVNSSIVVLGLGHAIGILAEASWLGSCDLHYWSDLDTHGFAMLDRVRSIFPRVKSLLMDRETLLCFRQMWTKEDSQFVGTLQNLSSEEGELYADLRFNRLGRGVRLEQERIPLSWLEQRI